MSATIEIDQFRNYFDNQIFEIHAKGRAYPVEEIYRPFEELDSDG